MLLRRGKEPRARGNVESVTMRTPLTLAFLAVTVCGARAAQLDELVSACDVAARSRDFLTLRRACAQGVAERFAFIVENGPYGGGAAGWRVGALVPPVGNQRFLVFHTPSRARDTTAHVFRVVSQEGDLRIGARLPDEPLGGYRVVHHRFDITLDPDARKTVIADRLTIERMPGADRLAILRAGSEFRVLEVRDETGPLDFAQCGGVLAIGVGSSTEITVLYEGSGLVGQDEAVLAGRVWWFSVGRLPATHSATIRMPVRWRLASMAPSAQRSPGVHEYVCKQPSAFLSLAAGVYETAERKHGSTTFQIYHRGRLRGTQEGYLTALTEVHGFMERLASSPWQRAALVVSSALKGPPLATPGLVVTSADTPLDALPRAVAQMWFGGLTPASYMRNAWPEALADYATLLMWRSIDATGTLYTVPIEAPTLLAEPIREGPVFLAAPELGRSVWDFARRKGCKALEMLEVEIGRSTMENALRLMLADAPTSRSSDWEDLQRAVDEATGQSYRWFFDFWLGMPLWAQPQASVQSGIAAISLPGMPGRGAVPVAVLDDRGGIAREMIARVMDQPARLELGRSPSDVVVDPWWRTLRRVEVQDAPALIEQLAADAWVIVPDELWKSSGALRQAIVRVWPSWRVVRASDVGPSDLHGRDVIFWGTGKHPLLWDLGVKFRLWEKDGRLFLRERSCTTATHSGMAVMRNPRSPERLIGRMFGIPKNVPWTTQAGAVVWDESGRPIVMHTDPILPARKTSTDPVVPVKP